MLNLISQKKYCLILLTFVIIFLKIPTNVNAQGGSAKKIDLIDADIFMYDKSKGENVSRVIGDVIFKHDDILLYCDSAYLYNDNNSVDALGHVHIKINDSLNIYGDSLKYNGNRKFAEIHNNVRLIDNQITLTTDHLNYSIPQKMGTYYDGGKVTDLKNNLVSKKGYYYSDKKDFYFKDSVVLTNPDYILECDTLKYNTQTEISYFYGPTTVTGKNTFMYCERGWYDTKNDVSEFRINAFMKNDRHTLEGDSIWYNQKTGLGIAKTNVTMTDSLENIILKGNYARYNRISQFSMVTENALMIQVDGTDSLFLHADTLKAIFDTVDKKAKILYAYKKAKFYRDNLQGLCDSLVYMFGDSTITMYYEPVLWSEEKQLTADTIIIQTANRSIHMIHLKINSFIISCDDTTENRYNQVKGLNITGYFEHGELSRIYVDKNAETIYYIREEAGQRIGINKCSSNSMMIYLSDNTIKTITYLDQPAGTMFPDNEIDFKELFLKNFIWLEKFRPKNKTEIFNLN